MSQDKYRKSLIAVIVGFCLLMLAVGLLTQGAAPSYADTVPTPAAHNPSGDALPVTFWSVNAQAASTNSALTIKVATAIMPEAK